MIYGNFTIFSCDLLSNIISFSVTLHLGIDVDIHLSKSSMVFQFKNIGSHLGTRIHGSEVRADILNAMKTSDIVVFDFSGVDVLSNSFADECFAKLTLSFTIDEIKSKTTFINTQPFIKSVIANSFIERLAAN